MNVCHGGNSDDLVSIPNMTGTVAVNFCAYFNGLYVKKSIGISFLEIVEMGSTPVIKALLKSSVC